MRDTFIRIAEETIALTAAGTYVAPSGRAVDIRDAVTAAVLGTFLLSERALGALGTALPAPAAPPAVRCLALRSGACVQRLLDEGARKIAVLNYANGVRPGGGFLHGSRAQEEALCRCSALYACLDSQRPEVRFFYDDNDAAKSALVRGHLLVSPDVPFFRDEDLALLEHPFPATVITGAAPDLGWLMATTSEGLEPRSRYDELPSVFADRTQAVLAAAHVAGCDAVVIGPWGCGAFGNDPDVVADAFATAIGRFGGHFSRIVCSTFGPGKNRDAFERCFGTTGS